MKMLRDMALIYPHVTFDRNQIDQIELQITENGHYSKNYFFEYSGNHKSIFPSKIQL